VLLPVMEHKQQTTVGVGPTDGDFGERKLWYLFVTALLRISSPFVSH
jgi:hypothetical protein